jgi:hypothetical protein
MEFQRAVYVLYDAKEDVVIENPLVDNPFGAGRSPLSPWERGWGVRPGISEPWFAPAERHRPACRCAPCKGRNRAALRLLVSRREADRLGFTRQRVLLADLWYYAARNTLPHDPVVQVQRHIGAIPRKEPAQIQGDCLRSGTKIGFTGCCADVGVSACTTGQSS